MHYRTLKGIDMNYRDCNGKTVKVGDYIDFIFWNYISPVGEIETHYKGRIGTHRGFHVFRFIVNGKKRTLRLRSLCFDPGSDWEKIDPCPGYNNIIKPLIIYER